MTITFVCRRSKVSKKDGLTPLELYVIINGKRRFVSLNRRIDPKMFNSKKQIVRGDDQVYKNANSGAETIYFTPLSAPKLLSSYNHILKSLFILSSYHHILIYSHPRILISPSSFHLFIFSSHTHILTSSYTHILIYSQPPNNFQFSVC